MLSPSSKVLAQTQTQQNPFPQAPVAANPIDSAWGVVGQYGIGIATLLAVLKAFADYQLKAAIEDRAIRSKSAENDLLREDRMYGSVMNQNEVLSTSQGTLLNTFIAKSLNQNETNNEQVVELIKTITCLTESIKSLGDSQAQVIELLYEIRESSQEDLSLNKETKSTQLSALASLDIIVNLANQTLATSEKLLSSTLTTNVIP